MSESLFENFNPVSAKAWKQKIQVDLKGEDYNQNLIWSSPEGIDVLPFYHRDQITDKDSSIPGQPDLWHVCQDIYIDNEMVANKLALKALEAGVESICFIAHKPFGIPKVFKGLMTNSLTFYFRLEFLSEPFLLNLTAYLKDCKAFINVDILGQLLGTGNWFSTKAQDHHVLNTLLLKAPKGISVLGADLSHYQNTGANMVQQLAYGLGHINEYFNHCYNSESLKEIMQDHNNAISVLNITLAIGSNYFFEIAKIRALRKLYALLASEYGFNPECHIFAKPSKRNKTLYDYNVNMLRTTTECMSAVLGGANVISNRAYDSIYHKSNAFAERIAKNQLLILKKESYFDAVNNASDGAYYIESLTQQLADKALVLFKDIEANGGFFKQLNKGIVQKKIKESAQQEQTLFDKGDLKLLGTNMHGNENDRMKDELELYPFLKNNTRKTSIEPLIERRLAETIEQKRLNNE
ncbi:MAG: methylmalonyl-CoA mutase subunit beta [Flavobacteriaceae bacterium]|nr:methylmalonyl-CoA mutase subunit beta [Flavobacteriaceae bacterium]